MTLQAMQVPTQSDGRMLHCPLVYDVVSFSRMDNFTQVLFCLVKRSVVVYIYRKCELIGPNPRQLLTMQFDPRVSIKPPSWI